MNINFEFFIVFVAAALYAINGVLYFSKGQYPWALVWLAYAVANIGLLWAANNQTR